MKNYRIGVFETNSSSTHSLTIRRITPQVGEIPKNEGNYNICDNVALPYNESEFGEVQKLRYLVGLIAGRIDEAANNHIIGSMDYGPWAMGTRDYRGGRSI